MKSIALLGVAVLAGAVRYPSEGPIPVRNEHEAQRLVDDGYAEFVDEADEGSDPDGLDDQKVEDLKKLASDEGADLGDATKKADIIAAIRAHRARS